jgi:hypothetical protein
MNWNVQDEWHNGKETQDRQEVEQPK